jgi:hypothetical protein
MDPNATFSRIARELEGMKVSHLWRGYGSAFFLEFGVLTPRQRRDGSEGNPFGEISIGIEWSWRIEGENSIICGSRSEEESWNSAFAQVRNTALAKLSLHGRLPELELAFTNGVFIASFMTAEGQPEWSITDRRVSPNVWLSVRNGALFEGDGMD